MSVISHEIKSPISAAIFQSKSIIDDIDTWKVSHNKIKSAVTLLNIQLVRTWKLLSTLFSIQYHDTRNVMLHREIVNFSHFIEYEIDFFSQVHADITCILKIDKKVGMVMIDKIQFQQVITNILENAVKYIDSKTPVIAVSVRKVGKYIECMIEDNGKWFVWVNPEDIFDKYRTWNDWHVWLWMGLYLCKKIISLHRWMIQASQSEQYGGAKLSIKIPIR